MCIRDSFLDDLRRRALDSKFDAFDFDRRTGRRDLVGELEDEAGECVVAALAGQLQPELFVQHRRVGASADQVVMLSLIHICIGGIDFSAT